MKISVWVLYILIATPAGPQYADIGEAYRTRAECMKRQQEFVAFAIQHHANMVLGAICGESKA